MSKIEDVISNLGLNGKDGLFFMADEQWKKATAFPNRVKRLIERKIQPTAFFCFDNKPLILFFENPSNKQELHEAIWNFNESPIAIISENDSVEIFNGFTFLKDERTLEKLGGIEKLNDFNYFELVTGKTWGQYGEQLNYKNRVDYFLLQNINAARKILVQDLDSKIANALIGKVIFVRYLIDRKVKLCFEGTSKHWSNNEFYDLLDNPQRAKSFFDYLEDSEKGFNGDLFPISENEYNQISTENYQVIKRLLQGEDLDKQQLSLFEFYDFSIIPIEFISNVYELFIGKENQEDEGAYYTPLFLVDYILKETVEKKLSSNDGYDCKVLDPACGSGIFLVETLRKIVEKYISTGVEIKSNEFKEAIKELAKENIYGVDKDLSAVQVAIFSIYLTLLDYLEPPEIETFKFPILFNKNFFEADFFDTKAEFNVFFENINFTYIIGNPPWKGGGIGNFGSKYLANRKKKEKHLYKKFDIAINNNEIAEGFVLRVSDFCKQNTQVSLIVRSSSLYNLGYNKENVSPFRQYWLEEFFINKIFELAPVRHEVFERSNDPAIAPAAILFYRYANGKNTDDNIVQHITLKRSRFFSLFKIFTINRTDYKTVQQKKFKEFDWLWKVLVYGSYLDFNFIKRLKENHSSIQKIICDKNKFVSATGIHSRKKALENPKDTSSIMGIPFLKTEAINSFYINYDGVAKLDTNKIDIVKDTRIYHSPMLLIREGVDLQTLTAKCAISTKNILFKDSITSIKILNNADLNILHNIAAILSTSLFAYYSISTFASIGIERERVKNYNKFTLPYIDLEIGGNIDKLQQDNQELFSEITKATIQDNIKISTLKNKIEVELKNINNIIFQKLSLNDVEIALVNYALEVNRILIVGNDREKEKLFSPISFNAAILNSYASLFVERFKSKLDNRDRKFVVEIWYTKQIVGMFFRMIPTKEYKQAITWIKKQDNAKILTFLSKIGSERITDKLFVQKDIRGFDNNGEDFFIIKPNEMRLWHKAIGYFDVNEFADAIITAGRGDQ